MTPRTSIRHVSPSAGCVRSFERSATFSRRSGPIILPASETRLSPLEFVEREFEHPTIKAGLLFFNGLREVDLRLPGFGHHIATLLLTFVYRHLPQLIASGKVFLAQPPLYRVSKGKEEHYAYDEQQRDALIKRLANGDGRGSVTVQRYKGLGEMNESQLWDTTMNPEKRTLLKVDMEDAVQADQIFQTLMGDEVEPRRDYIEKNAKFVSNLDI